DGWGAVHDHRATRRDPTTSLTTIRIRELFSYSPITIIAIGSGAHYLDATRRTKGVRRPTQNGVRAMRRHRLYFEANAASRERRGLRAADLHLSELRA